MRRTAKPFTIEIKKRGPRRRDIGDATIAESSTVSPWPDVPPPERGRVFQDAEKLFRASESRPTPVIDAAPAGAGGDAQPASSRRILPDLVAEAALTEAALDAQPEPRRRGRPPKQRPSETESLDVGDEPAEVATQLDLIDWPSPSAIAMPTAVLDLAASARRRAARNTDNLPRGERWKRRLPRVCW